MRLPGVVMFESDESEFRDLGRVWRGVRDAGGGLGFIFSERHNRVAVRR